MKKVYSIFFAVFITASVFAQAPQAVNYQGVARDSSGNVLSSQTVSLRLSILIGSPLGAAVYVETHSKTTDGFGLFSLKIGQGTIVSGIFSSISWGSNSYYLKVEIDPSGGSVYHLVGTSQFASVPYALYAAQSGTGGATGATGAQGIQGIQGVSGKTGQTGAQGIQGVAGAIGQTGAAGTNGTNGAIGNTGAQGIQGIAGANGLTGVSGTNGLNGAIGNTGAQGIQGIQGIQGLSGKTGATGAQGIQGIAGANGLTGASGTNGLNGAIGNTGATGAQGLIGAIGYTGANGQTGAQGIQGDRGMTGQTGVSGVNGLNGTNGTNGPTGANGTAGTNGQTGYTGATGATGAIGSIGLQGIQGIQGFSGKTGATGATGAVGLQGIQGIQGIAGMSGSTGVTGAVGATGVATQTLEQTLGLGNSAGYNSINMNSQSIWNASNFSLLTNYITPSIISLGGTNLNYIDMYYGHIADYFGSHGIDGQVLTVRGTSPSTWVRWETPSYLPTGLLGQTLRHDGTSWVANSNLFNNGSNIGIGTSSPNYKLHITGGDLFIQSSSGSFKLGYDGGNKWEFFTTNGGADLLMGANNGSITPTRLYFAQNGYVGIGSQSPSQKLTVDVGSEAASNGITVKRAVSTLYDLWGLRINYDEALGSSHYIFDDANDSHSLDFESDNAMAFNTGGPTQRMCITNTGMVGIGTTAPNTTFHVNGNGTDDIFRIQRLGGTKMWMDATGKIGIGTLFTPSNALDVYGGMTIGYNYSSVAPSWGLLVSGAVGIGTTTIATGYKLAVDGKIICTELTVQPYASWPDYVFADNYKLPSLLDLEKQIKENKHLPGIPSAKEVKDNGIHVGDMQTMMMEKIEQLTLYIIDLKKENQKMQSEIESLKSK